MSPKRLRNIERPQGRGKIFRGNEEIANVHYKLQVDQEIIIGKTMRGPTESEGKTITTGQLSVISGDCDLGTGEVYTLELSDGRHWQFFAREGDRVSGVYTASNASGEGLV